MDSNYNEMDLALVRVHMNFSYTLDPPVAYILYN